MAKTPATKSETAAKKRNAKGNKGDKNKSNKEFKITKTTKFKKNTKAIVFKKAQSPEAPQAPKKRAPKGLYYRTDESGALAVAKGDSDDEEEYGWAIDIYPDDPNDSDYVEDSDTEIVDSVFDGKVDHRDLDEEGGRYAVLVKSGEYVGEKLHEAQDAKHETCVLDVKKEHIVLQL